MLVHPDQNREGRKPGPASRGQMLRQFAVKIGEDIPIDGLGNDVVAALAALDMRHFQNRNALKARLYESLEKVTNTHCNNPR